jgi:hypothetical protein
MPFSPEIIFGPAQVGMYSETNVLYRTIQLSGLALALDFTTGVLDARVTATGGTNGTRTNAAGVLVAAATPRFDYSPTAIGTLRGLLVEESRTNLFLNSDLVGTNLGTQNVTVAAVPHTISFYGTGTITLSGVAVATINGTGAYPNRVTSTFTPTAGVLTCTVTGTVQFAQIEAGGSATSFIPTAGAAVARVEDSLVISEANFSSYWNSVQGTYIVECQPTVPLVGTAGYYLNTNGNLGLIADSASTMRAGTISSGDAITANTFTAGATTKVAGAYDAANPAICCMNGGAVAKNTQDWQTGSVKLTLGSRDGTASFVNAWLRKVDYYNFRLPDAQLQSLTT